MSLRRRVVVGFLAVAAVLVGANIVLAATFRSYLLGRVDEQLTAVGGPVGDRFFRGGDGRRPPGPRGGPPVPGGAEQPFTEYYLAWTDAHGGSLTQVGSPLHAGEAPPRVDPDDVVRHAGHREDATPFTAPAASGDGSWRLIAQHSPFGDQRISIVGISLADTGATLDRIRVVQIASTAAVLVALAAVSWWMMRLGVHPLEAMATTADSIAAGDLSLRVDHPDVGTEAGRLGSALNAMLGKIEEGYRALEASEARVRRFAADASHELRTPLTSIQGYAELWRAGGLRADAELSEAMRRMEQEARRMAALVDDLLLLARLDQRRPLDRAPVRLDEIAADGVRDAQAVQPERRISFTGDPVVVEGDELQLRQVVGNLLANTRVHTPPDAPVRVRVSVDGGVARLDVADEGPGMTPEVAARVFDRFYRADPSRARAAGGTGLGLSIVAAVAEAHGGRASVESAPGEGSRFTVELPGAR